MKLEYDQLVQQRNRLQQVVKQQSEPKPVPVKTEENQEAE